MGVKLLAVAYHEAGHAAMAIEAGQTFARIALSPTARPGGWLAYPRSRPLRRLANLEAPRRRTPKQEAADLRVLLGGCAAQACVEDGGETDTHEDLWRIADAALWLLSRQGTAASANDERHVLSVATRLGAPDPATFIPLAMYRAVALLARHPVWPGVEALAHELLARRMLSASLARKVYQASRGS